MEHLINNAVTADYCGQICGGGQCGNGPVCHNGIDPETHLPAVLNDRYAESIIGDRADDYDALEIHGVRDLNEPGDVNGTCCEVDDENPQFYATYAHLKMGGIICVGDFGTNLLAEQYARELAEKYGWQYE